MRAGRGRKSISKSAVILSIARIEIALISEPLTTEIRVEVDYDVTRTVWHASLGHVSGVEILNENRNAVQQGGISRRACLVRTGLVAGAMLGFSPSTKTIVRAAEKSAKKVRVAAIFTEFSYRSHAHVILENFLKPYLFCGEVIESQMEVISMWGDQFPDKEMSHEVSKEFKIPLVKTIAEAMTLGGSGLACDAVLLIGEHGKYGYNEIGQHMYPRKQFFDQIVDTMKRTQTFVPLFNDKHLSFRWDWAKEMYDTARQLGIPFMASSSVPLAHRIGSTGTGPNGSKPGFELPKSVEFEDLLLVHGGGPDSYDFHALEVLQSLTEGRKGGETGVSSVQCLQGDAVWKAAEEKLWNPNLVEVALRAELGDKAKDWKQISPTPYLILVRYKDGLVAPLVTVPGNRWAFACKLKGEAEPRGCQFHVGPWMNRNLFKALSHAIQHMFVTKKVAYPLERTLLTTGITEAVMKSRAQDGAIFPTPYLEFGYQATDFSAFRENGKSWDLLTYDVPEPKGLEPLGGITISKR